MARRPKLRPSYANDANYLARLAHSVEADTRMPGAWRRATVALLHELAARLAGASVGDVRDNGDKGPTDGGTNG